MMRFRILLVAMEPLLGEIMENAIGSQSDMAIAGSVQTH